MKPRTLLFVAFSLLAAAIFCLWDEAAAGLGWTTSIWSTALTFVTAAGGGFFSLFSAAPSHVKMELRQAGKVKRGRRDVYVEWNPQLPSSLVVYSRTNANDIGEIMPLTPSKTTVTAVSPIRFDLQTDEQRFTFEARDPEHRDASMTTLTTVLRHIAAAENNAANDGNSSGGNEEIDKNDPDPPQGATGHDGGSGGAPTEVDRVSPAQPTPADATATGPGDGTGSGEADEPTASGWANPEPKPVDKARVPAGGGMALGTSGNVDHASSFDNVVGQTSSGDASSGASTITTAVAAAAVPAEIHDDCIGDDQQASPSTTSDGEGEGDGDGDSEAPTDEDGAAPAPLPADAADVQGGGDAAFTGDADGGGGGDGSNSEGDGSGGSGKKYRGEDDDGDDTPSGSTPSPDEAASRVVGAIRAQDGLLRRWKQRQLYLVAGSTLKHCGLKRGEATASCKELELNHSSEVLMTDQDAPKRFIFRVSTIGASEGKGKGEKWFLDAESPEARDQCVALVQGVIARARTEHQAQQWKKEANDYLEFIVMDDNEDQVLSKEEFDASAAFIDAILQHPGGLRGFDQFDEDKDGVLSLGEWKRTLRLDRQETPRAENVDDHVRFSANSTPEPAFRGPELSNSDDPLLPGRFLSTAPLLRSASLEVTDLGDMIFREGDLPAYSTRESPIWTHRAGDEGRLCALKSWVGAPARLSVQNGQWRIGRGFWCTLGESPKPAGSWRTRVPWDARGKAIKNASLRINEDQTLVLASGDVEFWSSAPNN